MITRRDIADYFNLEVDEAAEKAKELREMDIDAKIAARKAIIELKLDPEFKESNEDGQVRLLLVTDNLSEFKEGEGVVLCLQASGTKLCECNILQFRESGDIEIVINGYNYNSTIDSHTSESLMLLKQEVSMLAFFQNFATKPAFFGENYFENHLINKHETPEIAPINQEEYQNNQDAVKKFWNISLNTAQNEAMMKAEKTQDYYLIQGPPGTGKSYLTAMRLIDEILSGRKVVLTGPTHMAINNALLKTAELLDLYYPEGGVNAIDNTMCKCGQSYNAKGLSFLSHKGEKVKLTNIQYLNVSFFNDWEFEDGTKKQYGWVIGMTPYSLQSRRARGLQFDTLFIDEAGQMTIPIAMMAMVEKHKVILAGDHKQLPPIISERIEHPDLKHSLFEHLMRPDNSTMLDVSFRMNDGICRLVSDLFYDGRLRPYDGGKRLKCALSDPLYSGEYPVVMVDCPDCGKQVSEVEAKRAIDIICGYIQSGVSPADIAVLAPFRAQCAMLRKRLAADSRLTAEQRQDIVIDTVDRMQGQEREIIIYSFTASDSEYMAEMAEFLYNPQKLNVAFSRAKNKLILLGNLNALKTAPSQLMRQVMARTEIRFVE